MMNAKSDLMAKVNGVCDHSPSDGTASDSDKDAKRKILRQKIIKTSFDGFASLFLGMQTAQMGPSFLDLQYISGTSIEQTSSYFTVHCFGYMVGALVAGFVYDKLGNKMALKCITLFLASFFTGLTPMCTSYVSMLMAHLVSAVMCSVVETAITADQFQMWGGKSDSALQFLSLTQAVGGVFGPLYTEPYLVPKWNETDPLFQHQDHERTNQKNNITGFTYNSINASSLPMPSINQSFDKNMGLEGNQTNSGSNFDTRPESELLYAYMITGFIGILFSVPYFILCCVNCAILTHEEKASDKLAEIEPKRLSLKVYVILTMVFCFFIFLETMLDDVLNVYLAMFVVSHLSWTKQNGALIISLTWGIRTICNLIAIPLVTRINMGILILISSVGMVITMTAFVLASQYHIHLLIWISISVFAVSDSTIVGGGYSWFDTNILKLDGKATSATLISASIGAMVGPLILGETIEKISLMVFPYTSLIICVMAMFFFLFMILFLKPYVIRKYGPVRAKRSTCIDIGSEVELEATTKMLAVNSKEDSFASGESTVKI